MDNRSTVRALRTVDGVLAPIAASAGRTTSGKSRQATRF